MEKVYVPDRPDSDDATHPVLPPTTIALHRRVLHLVQDGDKIAYTPSLDPSRYRYAKVLTPANSEAVWRCLVPVPPSDDASSSRYIHIKTWAALEDFEEDDLLALGVEVLQRVDHQQTYVCMYEGIDLGRIRELPFVLYADVYQMFFKLRGSFRHVVAHHDGVRASPSKVDVIVDVHRKPTSARCELIVRLLREGKLVLKEVHSEHGYFCGEMAVADLVYLAEFDCVRQVEGWNREDIREVIARETPERGEPLLKRATRREVTCQNPPTNDRAIVASVSAAWFVAYGKQDHVRPKGRSTWYKTTNRDRILNKVLSAFDNHGAPRASRRTARMPFYAKRDERQTANICTRPKVAARQSGGECARDQSQRNASNRPVPRGAMHRDG
ncbi:hypothetical protein BDZ85DRAFT_246199 [Elsinoe ampelina]|uniref:Uncharacterized protein n=1 Tax=Elsinoe ampelina TaxID=302913 RepID=A0A6A6GPM8_9PEZI|nr:hypothetical protein BDZ85DRAFT_246199 [Elsinoe ampelina]